MKTFFSKKVETAPARTIAKTIALAGSLSRIGTTTQCIQIVKYLQLMGYTVCYLEFNKSNYIETLKEIYEDYKEIDGKVVFEGIDLFTKDNAHKINELGYDYCIKDYGSACSESFESLSFVEQNKRILLLGIKPDEVKYAEDILEKYHETDYIFSFVGVKDREDILEQMLEKRKCTYFSEYTPDPYVYLSLSNSIYRQLLNV
jgi:hypothetical protein